MKKLYLLSALLLLTLGASCSLNNNTPAVNNDQNGAAGTQLENTVNDSVDNNLVGGDAVNPDDNDNVAAVVKEFTVHAGNFQFDVNKITVNKGDRVKINFINDEGFHDWVIDEFNARTKQIKAGESESIEFNATQTGTFQYYCSVGSHRQMGMVGQFIVQ